MVLHQEEGLDASVLVLVLVHLGRRRGFDRGTLAQGASRLLPEHLERLSVGLQQIVDRGSLADPLAGPVGRLGHAIVHSVQIEADRGQLQLSGVPHGDARDPRLGNPNVRRVVLAREGVHLGAGEFLDQLVEGLSDVDEVADAHVQLDRRLRARAGVLLAGRGWRAEDRVEQRQKKEEHGRLPVLASSHRGSLRKRAAPPRFAGGAAPHEARIIARCPMPPGAGSEGESR